jgi:paired amphipathic helix protein Sin3a
LQREWDKVWHAQTSSIYLKSLDHMGIHAKTADKKAFSAKYIVDQIKAKQEEQRLQRSYKTKASRYQHSFRYEDQDVILDAIRLLILHVNNYGQHNSSERERMAGFFERFLALFFDIAPATIQDRIRDISRNSPDDDMEDVTPAELTNGRGKRGNGKKPDLLRSVFNRKGQNGRQKDGSVSGSKESTPDNASTNGEDTETPEAPDDQAGTELSNEKWVTPMPQAARYKGPPPSDPDLRADQPYKRDAYNLYANQTILVFFSIFEILYRRLKDLKDSEDEAADAYRRSRAKKPAKEIGLIDEKADFFQKGHVGPFYPKALYVIEEYITGELDENRYQDFWRTYYLMKGWQLYTIQELLKSISRQAAVCVGQDNKEKTPEILALFEEDREKEETTHSAEIDYRTQVQKYIKDGEMFLLKYVSIEMLIKISIIQDPQEHNTNVNIESHDLPIDDAVHVEGRSNL